MSRPPGADESGSSLPELLLAAGLSVAALGMLATTVLGPLSTIAGWDAVDERQFELTSAADTVVTIVAMARPGLDGAAVVAATDDRIELRVGDLRRARTVVLRLADDQLRLELPEGPVLGDASGVPGISLAEVVERPIVDGIDTQRSGFVLRSVDGRILAGTATGTATGVEPDGGEPWGLTDVATIEVSLSDPDGDDGRPGRVVARSMHLRLRLPLAAESVAGPAAWRTAGSAAEGR